MWPYLSKSPFILNPWHSDSRIFLSSLALEGLFPDYFRIQGKKFIFKYRKQKTEKVWQNIFKWMEVQMFCNMVWKICLVLVKNRRNYVSWKLMVRKLFSKTRVTFTSCTFSWKLFHFYRLSWSLKTPCFRTSWKYGCLREKMRNTNINKLFLINSYLQIDSVHEWQKT